MHHQWWLRLHRRRDEDNDDNNSSDISPNHHQVNGSASHDKESIHKRDYAALRRAWDNIAESWSVSEFLVNPTRLDIKARYINDCLNEAHYNVVFVMDPVGERAAVVMLRDISAGEELYVKYGQTYWDSLEATTGIVPSSV